MRMIRITSEEELRAAFRSQDQDTLVLPTSFVFPLPVREYLSWLEPSGHRVYLVFSDPASERLRGLVFERTRGAADIPAAMCQWCHSVRTGGRVSLLTTPVGRDRRIGLHLCSDLQCREQIFGMPGRNDFQESLSRHERLQRVVGRMQAFARAHVF